MRHLYLHGFASGPDSKKGVAFADHFAAHGRALERLGFYNPVAKGNEKRVELNVERVKHWVSQGAQLSDKVGTLFKEASKASA